MRRTVVVGDVHGCREELEDLLAACSVGSGDDVVLVGDLVAKGPDSQGVVQLCRERGFRAVLGNHDAKVLELRSGRLSKSPKSTHVQVAGKLTPADWEYLAALPLWIRLEEHGVLVVHAGLAPNVPLREQRREDLLNMRSITPEGRSSKRVDGGAPWASTWPGPEHVVFGHDAVRGLQRHPHATGLDTGCVYGRSLTALIFPERRLVSVPARHAWAEPESRSKR
jgi:diadenosine tetraphosphatase ApaH/serine/threonine PP2A family protein phosphatase